MKIPMVYLGSPGQDSTGCPVLFYFLPASGGHFFSENSLLKRIAYLWRLQPMGIYLKIYLKRAIKENLLPAETHTFQVWQKRNMVSGDRMALVAACAKTAESAVRAYSAPRNANNVPTFGLKRLHKDIALLRCALWAYITDMAGETEGMKLQVYCSSVAGHAANAAKRMHGRGINEVFSFFLQSLSMMQLSCMQENVKCGNMTDRKDADEAENMLKSMEMERTGRLLAAIFVTEALTGAGETDISHAQKAFFFCTKHEVICPKKEILDGSAAGMV